MEILFKHGWILFITATIINWQFLKHRSKKYSQENPELEEGYLKFSKGFLFYGSIPWLIMMMGDLSGMTQGVFEYFNPKAMNPMVLLFHLSIVVLWLLSVWWIYFKGGAEFIEKHPGLVRKSSLSGNTNVTAKQIKLFYPLMLIGGIVAMVMMWVWDIPIPQF